MKRMDWSGYALSLLRIVAAALFICHGLQKLFGFPVAAGPRPHMGSLLWIAGVLESIGGVCILLGLFTLNYAHDQRFERVFHSLMLTLVE